MTIVKDIQGMAFTQSENYKGNVVVRFTSDHLGETISLEFGGVMISVPFEPVKEAINEARAGNEKYNSN